jgi:hypothetical protein
MHAPPEPRPVSTDRPRRAWRWCAAACLVVALPAVPVAARADAQAERAVRALESSSSLKVRSQAALVLGQLGAVQAGPALRRAALSDPAPAVRIAAVAALARLGVDQAAETLMEVEKADADAGVRASATGALAELRSPAAPSGVPRTGLAVSIEEVAGSGGGPADRLALRDALGRRLEEAGFLVQHDGGLRLKPSIVKLDVAQAGPRTEVAIRAELVAVEGGGRMAAMLEGSARLAATGVRNDRDLGVVSVRAADAVAKVLVDDLAARLAER